MLLRVQEDRAAVKLLGGVPVCAAFLDAVYRRGPGGGWLIGGDGMATQSDSIPAEPALVAGIATAIERVIATERPGLIVTCTATGRHVDHVRARDGALAAARRTGLPVRCWQDLPYALHNDEMRGGSRPARSSAMPPSTRCSATRA